MELGRRLKPFVPLILLAGLACLVWTDAVVAQSATVEASKVPPWKRQLAGDDAQQVEALAKTIDQLKRAGQFAEAIEPARKILAICERACGPDHWQTADARRNGDDLHTIAALPEEGRKALASVGDLSDRERAAYERARYGEAGQWNRALLEICRRWLGEGHPETALSSSNLAINLNEQGKYAEAEPLFRKALAIKLNALREDHPSTAASYMNLGSNLNEQGKHAEAEPLLRKALAIDHKTLGEDHSDTAYAYNSLASCLSDMGRHAEAEPLYRKALAIRITTLGAEHRTTSTSYGNLAYNLDDQGRYAEAEPLRRKALAIRLIALGEGHASTAHSSSNLAFNLDAQKKHAEAEPLHRQALAVFLKTLGEKHPSTAVSYNNLARNLEDQGKSAEAEKLFRKALAIFRDTVGEDHPQSAYAYNNLASNLDAQGKYAEAEPLHRTALMICLKTLGAAHAHTAGYNTKLAENLDHQGKRDEAVQKWTLAAAAFEANRYALSASGLGRSLTSDLSPLPALALALARQDQPLEAWRRWESDLSRGLLDDLSARQLRPLTSGQRQHENQVIGQLQRLGERLARLAAKARRTQDEDRQLDALRNQQSTLLVQWLEFQTELDRQYQAYAGKPAPLAEIQAVLTPDSALVGWVDVKNHHGACVVRHQGDPLWVKVPGSGQRGAWTQEDDQRPRKLREALAGRQSDWRALAEALASQRLAPLMPRLNGVKHLIILPSRALAGVPIETLIAAGQRGDSLSLVVSYAPSGSLLTRLSAPRSQPPGPARLLALGDPAFPKPAPSGPAPAPPKRGIAIQEVAANSTADLFGIQAGDVLLEYNGKALEAIKDLAIVPASDKANRVPIKLWRDGEVRALEIAAGPLGIQSDPGRTAAQVVLAQRAAAEVLAPGVRGERLAALPGTRREVQAIAALFPMDQATMLLGADATESRLQHFVQSGAFQGYRYLHLATHGKANPSVALSSALFLAAEPERPTASAADAAAWESAPDGQITAEQIVRTWELDADLVVLSACESGLGRYAGGEGYLGFAQALFVKGARSLVLSQWKVDDKATALLMTRFYQNLLGRRAELARPMPKAQALDEAKRWLRNLTLDQVGGELAALDRGPVRPLADGGRTAIPSPRSSVVRPYAHPYYWAAFVLVGNPD
jgi:CHAT domain-containing protein/Flp pilus assembly protein TadD